MLVMPISNVTASHSSAHNDQVVPAFLQTQLSFFPLIVWDWRGIPDSYSFRLIDQVKLMVHQILYNTP